ncbi:MAG: 4-hydroxy-tetrahydrodipicolinate reductase [Ignavibacteriales bacterium]|nr:4-hydroxy-tetrahydrodipicolinate reductase [Ignavibacteriales bacterium]
MNIALLGYGNMGKEIERLAAEKNIVVKKIFTIENNLRAMAINKETLKDVDVCIDFSVPTAVVENIKAVSSFGKNIVVGTTGWYDKMKDVEKIVEKNKIGFLYSPNFSLGMNIFFQILYSTSHIFDKFDCYDPAIHETHHRNKVDSPSGTALTLGQIVLSQIRRKNKMYQETAHKQLKSDELHISSTRVGNVVGQHHVLFDSEADSIELIHTAKNRAGFAMGALIAAQFLKGKKGIYTMKDVITSF